jgi:hypothetical protein
MTDTNNTFTTLEEAMPLSPEQQAEVAGGRLFPLPPVGCMACTSGGPIDILGTFGNVVKDVVIDVAGSVRGGFGL